MIDNVLNALATECGIQPMDNRPMNRVLSRQAVARLIGVSPRSVSIYARQGIIEAVCLGKTAKRANGYSESSVCDAIMRRHDAEQQTARRRFFMQRVTIPRVAHTSGIDTPETGRGLPPSYPPYDRYPPV